MVTVLEKASSTSCKTVVTIFSFGRAYDCLALAVAAVNHLKFLIISKTRKLRYWKRECYLFLLEIDKKYCRSFDDHSQHLGPKMEYTLGPSRPSLLHHNMSKITKLR